MRMFSLLCMRAVYGLLIDKNIFKNRIWWEDIMTPTANYKDYKGETLKLSCAGRINDHQLPLGIKQISNVNFYYNPQKFPETRFYIKHNHS